MRDIQDCDEHFAQSCKAENEAEAESEKWQTVLLRLIQTPRTRRELARKLRERGCPDDVAEPLLDRFEELGLIDDRLYATIYIETKKSFGLTRLRDELRFRGVSRENIESALDEVELDETERAVELLSAWSAQPGAERRKLDAKLRRRGFSSQAVREALEQVCRNFPE